MRRCRMSTRINADDMDHRVLNEEIRKSDGKCLVTGCCGQRFIAAGMSDREVEITGIPGKSDTCLILVKLRSFKV